MVLERLKSLRQNRGWSCEHVADLTGISKVYYWQIENGRRGLSYDLAVKISSAFGMKPDEIFLPTELSGCEQKAK